MAVGVLAGLIGNFLKEAIKQNITKEILQNTGGNLKEVVQQIPGLGGEEDTGKSKSGDTTKEQPKRKTTARDDAVFTDIGGNIRTEGQPGGLAGGLQALGRSIVGKEVGDDPFIDPQGRARERGIEVDIGKTIGDSIRESFFRLQATEAGDDSDLERWQKIQSSIQDFTQGGKTTKADIIGNAESLSEASRIATVVGQIDPLKGTSAVKQKQSRETLLKEYLRGLRPKFAGEKRNILQRLESVDSPGEVLEKTLAGEKTRFSGPEGGKGSIKAGRLLRALGTTLEDFEKWSKTNRPDLFRHAYPGQR